MRRFQISRGYRLVVGVAMAFMTNSAARADEPGVVRISDRTPVIRAQSPEASPVQQTGYEPCVTDYGPAPSGACNTSCPPHGVCGPSHGLVVGGWYGDADCERGCPDFIDCPYCEPGQHCPHCGGTGITCGDPTRCGRWSNGFLDCFANGCDRILNCLHDGLGLADSGGEGAGVPLIGHYVLNYPVNPEYFDGRDGQVYAAPGYGGPVSVPLAPVVRHTYNYGWGVPSSRLTPVSHPIAPIQ